MKKNIQYFVYMLVLLIGTGCDKEPMTFESPLQGMDLEDTTGITQGFLLEPITSVSCGACPLAHHEIELIEEVQNDVFHMTHYMHGPLHHPYTQYVIDQVNKTVYTPLSFVQRANNDGSVVYYDVDRYNEILEGVRTSPVEYDLGLATGVDDNKLSSRLEIIRKGDVVESELGVTAILVEKSVTGTGSGYDQRNYGHNDESHPYYNRGKYIEGFEHTNVIRYVLTPFEGLETTVNQASTFVDLGIDLNELTEDVHKYALIVFITEEPSLGSPILNARYQDLADL